MKVSKSKKIFFLSYYYNLPGACQAEWASDRVNAIQLLGHRVTVLTSFVSSSGLKEKIIRIPSLGFKDARDEINYYSENNKPNIFQKITIFVFSILGLPFDFLIKVLTKNIGEGRWMWAVTSTFRALLSWDLYKSDFIISTGGPASSHLAAVIISKITKKKCLIELQDPMSGEGIGREGSRELLKKMEYFLLRHASMSVFVTKTACSDAIKKYNIKNIDYIYPGAPEYKFNLKKTDNPLKFNLIHMGSLYGTRNLFSLTNALNTLDIADKEKFSVSNIGHADKEIVDYDYKDITVSFLPHTRRDLALEKVKDFDIMLLIQNTDNRSSSTIPFKTYDYLQLGMPIFAMINSNDELKNILQSNGHIVADINNINDISDKLRFILENPINPIVPKDMVPKNAAKKMIRLIDNL